jgi:6-phosphofructokinase 1
MNKRIGIITSGGDASGINAVFHGLLVHQNIDVLGFQDGYDGIIHNDPMQLTNAMTSRAILNGESIVRTARSKATLTEDGRRVILKRLAEHKIDSLVVCGGDGSGKAAYLLSEMGLDTLLIPMTIDNNIYGSEYTIGYYTALESIRTCVQRIHQTGHNMPGRVFMIETFGGDSGQLTLAAALYCGADIAIIPEREFDIRTITERIKDVLKRKQQCIILCCESSFLSKEYHLGDQGASFEVGQKITEITKERVRHTILGYCQRAGDPELADIEKALLMGYHAGVVLLNRITRQMIGIKDNKVTCIPLEDIWSKKKGLDQNNCILAEQLKII